LANRYALVPQWAAIGASMGGYGALKVALRNPSNCVAVAALSPAIFPAETSERVPMRNLSSVLNDLNLAMGTDIATYASKSVYGILRNNLVSLSKVAPQIFIDCGEKDEFNLHDGAVYLHEAFDRLSIPHTFKSIRGACHADEHTSARQETAHLSLLLQRDCIYVQADRGMNMAKSKTVLITGASSGIGKATALYFQPQGWNVIATMRDPEHGKELRALDQVLVTSLDVTNSDSIQQAVKTGLEGFQSIGVPVNNAGFGAYGPLEATSMETVRRHSIPTSSVCWRPQRRCCRTSAPSTPA
jgi:hypothetical protein